MKLCIFWTMGRFMSSQSWSMCGVKNKIECERVCFYLIMCHGSAPCHIMQKSIEISLSRASWPRSVPNLTNKSESEKWPARCRRTNPSYKKYLKCYLWYRLSKSNWPCYSPRESSYSWFHQELKFPNEKYFCIIKKVRLHIQEIYPTPVLLIFQ